jgi:elongation factor Ts
MAVNAADVKALREMTGVGIMDCKKALVETGGDTKKAVEYLRKMGLKTLEKKAGREAKEGLIQHYIHPGSRLGVLVEINCETDFVAKTDDFQTFAKNVAMHIAASNPKVVKREELPQEIIDKEMEIYRTQAIEQKKPENIIDRFAQGKLEKYYQEVCLLEQSYIRDPNVTIQELLKETVAKLGENIVIKRFVRYQLGE